MQPFDSIPHQPPFYHQLLHQIVSQIHRGLALPTLVEKTVTEVRSILAADRLVLYQLQGPLQQQPPEQLHEPAEVMAALPAKAADPGQITYEVRATDAIPSVLQMTETACGANLPQLEQRYRSGQARAVDDVAQTYRRQACLRKLLQRAEVKSLLIAPMWVQGQLWGLLIAHQCQQRQWQSGEIAFLQQVAAHLAIAVTQAQLQQQLQQQTTALETAVTERTQALRDALMAAEAASLAKGEFLSTMSHELRSPLTCIIGMSATLLRWPIGELSPRQRSYLTTINRSGEQLLDSINDVLEVARIESGRTVLEMSEFSLTALARNSLRRFQEQAEQQQVSLSLDLRIEPSQDPFTADPRRLQQILSYLLSNAIKFTPAAGRAQLSVWREPQCAVFQLKDTGIGIPESQQTLLFEQFKQLESSLQRQYPGAGLGLALTKQLVELHGGSIQVSSRVGQGSEFTVRIPEFRPPADSDIYREKLSAPSAGRILLVENEDSTARLVSGLLSAAGYQVIWMLEGSRLFEQVTLLQPQVLIADLDLVKDRQTLADCDRYLTTSDLKILVLTQLAPEAISAAIPEQFDDAIHKPLDPQLLLQKVQALTPFA
ncbi:GAF domain-containing protein [Romeria aff. gracilis LEGE 07310]|uniref:histidine kinase n=1 Tax=Vasconcelosia minhoensis LEGE 07310 TaxID=915328 RepID=A0A8J7AZ16_9CYAN|nr:ATP-binding protein [Romeria gracilis]MBE9078972.1 GAF domain-containing protein [Romeria aff. gracilis LEGE 07310]